ncbi:MAG TPA: hypothetical protein VK254_00180 [Candidatus Bathyarchaeia archaeon]|nr:hypothetical protein [Candidatus Bathyarchaeia archaeon]
MKMSKSQFLKERVLTAILIVAFAAGFGLAARADGVHQAPQKHRNQPGYQTHKQQPRKQQRQSMKHKMKQSTIKKSPHYQQKKTNNNQYKRSY